MIKPVWLIAAAGIMAAMVITSRRPMESTMPAYAALAERLRVAPVASSFEPLGYSFLIASVPGEAVEQQAKVLHLTCYVALALLSAWFLSTTGTSHPVASTIAMTAILFNPYVLINLFRLNDNNVNVPAIAALFMALSLSIAADSRQRTRWLVAASVLLGVVLSVRPNAITMIGVVIVVACMREVTARLRWRRSTSALGSTALVIAAYMTCAWAVSGQAMFWPSNGPYNLFAGNNPAALSTLQTEYNAETSLPAGLQWCGVDQPLRAVEGSTFTACTIRFWRENPATTVRLAGLKFYTMVFRPNLRLADSPFEVALQLATMLLPLAWWSAAIAIAVRRRELIDPLALAFITLYVAPFVLTNADPRFRLPLDAVYAMSLASPSVLAKLRAIGPVSIA